MLETKGQKVFQQTRLFKVELSIKGKELTNDLRTVKIISSLKTGYQIVHITVELDPNDVIMEDIFAGNPIKLKIKLIGVEKENIPSESIEFELQYWDSNFQAPSKNQTTTSTQQYKQRTAIGIYTVCRKPFKTMTTQINQKFENKTVREIIEEFVSSKTEAELHYDSDQENQDKIPQCFMPPTTVYKMIRSLDNNFGLYESAPSNLGFCQHDNKLYVQNLKARMKKNPTFTIYHLAQNDRENPNIIKKCNDGKKFYTYGQLMNTYTGSKKINAMGSNIVYISYPKDKLYKKLEFKIKDLFNEVGLIDGDGQYKEDKNTDNTRKRYVTSHSGNEDSETFAKAKLAREIMGLSQIQIGLEKSLKVLNLMKVGEPVKIKTKSAEYKGLGGKYILYASDISFSKESNEWIVSCVITCIRTNQYSC